METLLTILTPGLEIIATGLAGWLVTIVMQAVQAHTQLKFTEQQRALLVAGADNAAGTLVTMLLAKTVTPVQVISPTSQVIVNLASGVIDRMPGPAAAVGVDTPQMAAVIVGRVGQLLAKQPEPVLAAIVK